jgi:SAM-dependent methyltransferase
MTQETKSDAYYDSRLQKYGVERSVTECYAVQDIRFAQALRLLEVGAQETVSDLGCGTGDFCVYLRKHGYEGTYWGYDHWKKGIELAKERTDGVPRVFFRPASLRQLMTEAGKEKESDIVTAFSVFSHRSASLSEMQALFMDTIDLAYRMCKIGCAITAKSPYKTEARIDESIFDPMWMWQIGRRLSERVLIDHSYAPYESMLVVFKKESEFRRIWNIKGGWKD